MEQLWSRVIDALCKAVCNISFERLFQVSSVGGKYPGKGLWILVGFSIDQSKQSFSQLGFASFFFLWLSPVAIGVDEETSSR